MSIAGLLHAPPPPHVFSVDAERLLYVRLARRRDLLERIEILRFAEAWHQLGPVGLLQVDRAALAEGLRLLIGRLDEPPRRASLVVPNAWVRSVVVDVESLPRGTEEAEEVVRWRLKRVLPCRPEEVRLDWSRLGENGDLLVLIALDKPLAGVEDVFAAAGIELGRIEPAALALTTLVSSSSAPKLLVQLEERAAALVVLAGGRPLLVRHKALPLDPARAVAFLERELGRTLAHARERAGSEPLELWLMSPRAALASVVQRWAEQQPGIVLQRPAAAEAALPAGVAEPDRLLPLLACGVAEEA